MTVARADIAVGHVDDAASLEKVLTALRQLHGEHYDFAVERWEGEKRIEAMLGTVVHLFVVGAEEGQIRLYPGEQVRGPSEDGPYRLAGEVGELLEGYSEEVWPGDAICVDATTADRTLLTGGGTFFKVVTEATAYPFPRLALLRNLPSLPGGCAAYDGAFRRETLPPQEVLDAAVDRRGNNRVNQHTLDMRPDRQPLPRAHYHGQVAVADGAFVNHSETALVLPRSVYDLPPVRDTEEGEIALYPHPAEEPEDFFTVPMRPGSIAVTPAAEAGPVGHRFIDAFAMLVAIPGFVAPTQWME